MGENVRADVCIIGSGFAGSVIANELAATGKQIAIIEAGDWQNRDTVQLNLAKGVGSFARDPRLHLPIAYHGNMRFRAGWTPNVGGHVHWTAWAIRPLENSFRVRSLYGVSEDWPITYDDLEPYYCRAEDELGVSGNSKNPQGPRRSKPYPMEAMPYSYSDQKIASAMTSLGLGYDALPVARNRIPRRGRAACCFNGTCEECPTTAKYRADFVHVPQATANKNVVLFHNRVGIKLVLDEQGRVARLDCELPDRTPWSVSADTFVVAGNTFESTRLLLNSAQANHPNGLANGSGTAGRYLADHPDSGVGGVSPESLWGARTMFALIGREFEDGPWRKDSAGFLYCAAPSWATPVGAGLDAVDQGKFGRELKQEVQGVSRQVAIGATFEMRSVAENRVELDSSVRDYHGRPGMKVFFSHGDYEERAQKKFKEKLSPVLRKLGCTAVGGDDSYGVGFHTLGTLRLGNDPKRSVVNANLRTHEVENLYVASSAVYASSLGPSNPTLTLVALSLRLGDHLRREVLK